MTTEYRLVTERPGHQNGRKRFYKQKRNWEHARDSLKSHAEDMKRYDSADLEPWHAWIETREVSKWERVDLAVLLAVDVTLIDPFAGIVDTGTVDL